MLFNVYFRKYYSCLGTRAKSYKSCRLPSYNMADKVGKHTCKHRPVKIAEKFAAKTHCLLFANVRMIDYYSIYIIFTVRSPCFVDLLFVTHKNQISLKYGKN